MSLLEKNLSFFPELVGKLKNVKAISNETILKARDGNPTVKFEGRFLHSNYNPIEEAKKLIASYKIDEAPLIVMGFGLGYHVREIQRRYPDRRLLVIERNLAVLKKALELFDFTKSGGKIKFYTEENVRSIMTEHEFYKALNSNPTIIVHEPSTFSFIKFYQNITDSILSLNKFSIDKRVKVSVVSPIMGGSVSVSRFVETGLGEIGAEVDYIDNTLHYGTYREIISRKCSNEEREKAKAAFYRYLTDNIENRINDYKPDLVFALAQAPVSVRLLNSLHSSGIKTAFWFVENFRHLTYWKYMAAFYDYFFTIQKDEFHKQLETNGIRNYYFLPVGACTGAHKRDLVESYDYEITFIGAGYRNRELFFERILSKKPDMDFSIWGNEWPENSIVNSRLKDGGRRLSTGEVLDTYARSKIVLNLHSSVDKDDRDYINPRTFELAAMGVFQLVDQRDSLSDFFEIGKEIITFQDENDFIEKADYYLNNDLERTEIALRARTRVLKDHSYANRLTEMLTHVFGIGVLKSIGHKSPGLILEKEKALTKVSEEFGSDKALNELGKELVREQIPVENNIIK